MAKPIPFNPRYTHSFHPLSIDKKESRPEYAQMDAYFISEKYASFVKRTVILPYVNRAGVALALPKNHAERDNQPSDHWFIGLEIDWKAYLSARNNLRLLDAYCFINFTNCTVDISTFAGDATLVLALFLALLLPAIT